MTALFLRFLRFGLLAWGGPVAQIAMIRQELVEEQGWISPERFNRVLAIYQALPGPEAHELCVYFGMQQAGRRGGLLAGLGFMLPGFLLMFGLSWFYVRYGIGSPIFAALFNGFKPAVAALIVRGVQRIGQHALKDTWLWALALLAGLAQWFGINFVLTLAAAGLIYAVLKRPPTGDRRPPKVHGQGRSASLETEATPVVPPAPDSSRSSPDPTVGGLLSVVRGRFSAVSGLWTAVGALPGVALAPSLLALFGYGLRTGLLTFGGAYTAIPFLQHDAVVVGGWMTDAQFLDGLALSGILPAPLIIFSTFVGYLGGGPWGALALTAGVFLPAFAFTLVGYSYLERVVENPTLHTFLDGVTAGVVGLIAATSLRLLPAAIPDLPALGIFALALFVLFRWKAKAAVAVVILGAGVLGLLIQ